MCDTRENIFCPYIEMRATPTSAFLGFLVIVITSFLNRHQTVIYFEEIPLFSARQPGEPKDIFFQTGAPYGHLALRNAANGTYPETPREIFYWLSGIERGSLTLADARLVSGSRGG